MSTNNYFTKKNLDDCLKALAKEFRKRNGKTMPAEIVLVGGAAVLVSYRFRDKTYDIDAIIHESSAMKEAINYVGDTMSFPNGWLNSDFTKTKSYSPKLRNYSIYYKTFSNILTVRTISGEYLVAMKLMSGRQYKNDISDIVGILWEQKKSGKPIAKEQIDRAVYDLYGGWNQLPSDAETMIDNVLKNDNLEELYHIYREEEQKNKTALVKFEKEYPDVLNGDNLQNIIESLKARRNDNELVDK